MTDLPAAVLWDLDGTLIDSEPYWVRAQYEIVGASGGVWSDDLAKQLIGSDLLVSAQFMIDNSPLTQTPEEIVDLMVTRVVEQMRIELTWRPGARELLEANVAAGVPNALVTMSWRPISDTVVATLAQGTFAAVVTGDQVDHGKPHPEPYAAACRALGVAPGDCVAIEDSPTGVTSAAAAGVRTIAVPHLLPIPRIPGSVQVPSLRGLRPGDLTSLFDG